MSLLLLQESVKGLSHETCEDYAGAKEGDGYVMFAVADGHGSSSCARSGVGSKLAVQAAFDVLAKVAQTILHPASPEQQKWEPELLSHRGESKLLEAIAPRIVDNWKRRVKRHWDDHPLDENEIMAMGQEGRAWAEARDPHVYGTTLLAGLLLPNLVLLLRKGDGTCMAVFEDAHIVDVLPEEDECVGNVTTSMCDSNAAQTMQFEVLDRLQNDPIAVFVATDGVDKSLAGQEAVANFLSDVTCQLASADPRESKMSVRETLMQLRDEGIGDDTSMAGYVDVNRARPCIQAMQAQKASADLRFEEQRLTRELNSMERKAEHAYRRKQELDDLKARLSQLEAEIEEDARFLEEYQRMNRELEDLRTRQTLLESGASVSAAAPTNVPVKQGMAVDAGERKTLVDMPRVDDANAANDDLQGGVPSGALFRFDENEDAAVFPVADDDPSYVPVSDFEDVDSLANMPNNDGVIKRTNRRAGARVNRRRLRRSRKMPRLHPLAIAGVGVMAALVLLCVFVAIPQCTSSNSNSVEQGSAKATDTVQQESTTEGVSGVPWESAKGSDTKDINKCIEGLANDEADALREQLVSLAGTYDARAGNVNTIADECLGEVQIKLRDNDVFVNRDDEFETFAYVTVEVKGDASTSKSPVVKHLILVKEGDAGSTTGAAEWRLYDSEGLAKAIAEATDFETKCKSASEGVGSEVPQDSADDYPYSNPYANR